MGSGMYEGKALANQAVKASHRVECERNIGTGYDCSCGALNLTPAFVRESVRYAHELDEAEAHEMNDQLSRYVRQLRHCQQPEELIRQNSADFIAMSDVERARIFGDDDADEEARADALDAAYERHIDQQIDAAKERE